MDAIEQIRKEMVSEINSNPSERQNLESKYGQVWDTNELQKDFSVKGFSAPFVIVERKSDNKMGTLTFQHSPRFYFDFNEA